MKYSNVIISTTEHFYNHSTFCISLPPGAEIQGMYTYKLKDLTEYTNPNNVDLTFVLIADGSFELIVMSISYGDDIDEHGVISRSFVITSEDIKDNHFKFICKIDNTGACIYEVNNIPEDSRYNYLLFC